MFGSFRTVLQLEKLVKICCGHNFTLLFNDGQSKLFALKVQEKCFCVAILSFHFRSLQYLVANRQMFAGFQIGPQTIFLSRQPGNFVCYMRLLTKIQGKFAIDFFLAYHKKQQKA